MIQMIMNMTIMIKVMIRTLIMNILRVLGGDWGKGKASLPGSKLSGCSKV